MLEPLKDRLTYGIANRIQRRALGAAMRRGRGGRAASLLKMQDPEQFRSRVRATKEQSIEQLDKLVNQFVSTATKRGTKAFFAKDGAASVNYIAEIVKATGARMIAKSKSLTTEEIEMNHPLEQMGYKIVETDLGERIIQLAGRRRYTSCFPGTRETVQSSIHTTGRADESERRGRT
jgi:L-lactate dehydrogenase complex protein LldF